MSIRIDPRTLRRFILGKSGLWPGRRWQGKAGAAAAIRQIGSVQVDPLQIIARNHDLKLYSRVTEYTPADLDALLYTDRQFFDYGGLLHIYPMHEFPYWKLHMRRQQESEYWTAFATENARLIDEVRAALRERGPLMQRDLAGNSLKNYYARKDSGLALVYLWRIGELMTARRQRFERVYDFTENILPAQHRGSVSDAEAEAFFARKALHMHGLPTATEWRGSFAYFTRRSIVPAEGKRLLEALIEVGEAVQVQVEGRKDTYYLPASDLTTLETVQAGRTPEAWTPHDSEVQAEVNFLAPLDPVSARGRAMKLFGFAYTWEVYVPAEKRRWGYYVLPILYGDTLAARADFRLDKPTKTLQILAFYLEDEAFARDAAFAAALARGLARFARFHVAEQVDLAGVAAPLRDAIESYKLFASSSSSLNSPSVSNGSSESSSMPSGSSISS